MTARAWLCVVLTTAWGAAAAEGRELPLQESAFAEAVRVSSPGRPRLGADPVSNRVAIVNNGYDALLLRVHLIRHASRSIDVQTFIWTDDECGRLMICELLEAARRGVRVRIIADHLVSEKNPATMAFLATAHPNLEVRHYRPAASRIRPSGLRSILSGMRSFKDINQRMHNKVMVFDEVALITGGRNIENTYYNLSSEMNFKDRDVLAIGPVAAEAAESFEEFWDCRWSVPSRDLLDVRPLMEAGQFRRYDRREDFDFGGRFQSLDAEVSADGEMGRRIAARLHPVARACFIADRPGKNRSVWLRGHGRSTEALADILASATNSVIMQSPYLVLSSRAAALFESMKRRTPGLRIAVSSNSFGSTDNLLAYSANYRLRGTYISTLGVEVHEYMPHPADLLSVLPQYPALENLARERMTAGQQERLPFLCIHAKSVVVDDRVAFIGSFNLDPRSENLNTEVGLLIEDRAVADELRADIRRDMSGRNSWVIANREAPLHLDKVNALLDGVFGLLPIDVWPLQNTTSFELLPGCSELPPGDPGFHRCYREAGDFPGADGILSRKEIVTRLYKAVGPVLTPLI